MGEFRPNRKQDFDLEVVLRSFKECLQPDGQLSLKYYLLAFHELCRFFSLTGKLFSFVAKDLEKKMKPLESKMSSDSGRHYVSLQSMLQHETQEGVVRQRGRHPSGARQFLRLHYALEFILEFMRRLRHSKDDARTAEIATEVYEKTLSKHHPWFTRQLTYLAVYILPSKKTLIDIMCKHNYDKVHDLIDDVVAEGKPIYDVSQNVYDGYNLEHIH